MKPLQIGDRVAIYTAFGRDVCTITSISESGIVYSDTYCKVTAAHPKQCRRLKPKPKSVRITREMLAKAWDAYVADTQPGFAEIYSGFDVFCRKLGL